jgi:hypothetical protein
MKTIIITLATAVTFYGDVMAQQVLTLGGHLQASKIQH